MKAIGYIAATLAVMFYGAVMNGWALCKLWDWFIVTQFGLAALSIPAAIGLGYIVSYLTHQIQLTSDSKWSEVLLKAFIWATIKPIISIAFGAVVATFL